MFNFDDASVKNKEALDAMVNTYEAAAKGFQTIATEAADYTKKSFENGVAHVESLTAVKSIEAALELQSSYLKTTYETFVAQMTKMGEIYSDLAKAAYKKIETVPAAIAAAPAKAAKAAQAAAAEVVA
jgi:hypothetical protein